MVISLAIECQIRYNTPMAQEPKNVIPGNVRGKEELLYP